MNHVFIGYGIDFLKNSPAQILNWYTQAGLTAYLTPADQALMQNYYANPDVTNQQAMLSGLTHLPNEPAATQLLAVAVDDFEAKLDQRLGYVLDQSKE